MCKVSNFEIVYIVSTKKARDFFKKKKTKKNLHLSNTKQTNKQKKKTL